MKKLFLLLVFVGAGCSKPQEQEKEATVKKDEVQMGMPRTTQEAATGQTPGESVAEAQKVAAAAQASLDEKGEGMEK